MKRKIEIQEEEGRFIVVVTGEVEEEIVEKIREAILDYLKIFRNFSFASELKKKGGNFQFEILPKVLMPWIKKALETIGNRFLVS